MNTPEYPMSQAARQIWVGRLLDINLADWIVGIKALSQAEVDDLESRDIAPRLAGLVEQLQAQEADSFDGTEASNEAAQLYIQHVALLGDAALVELVQRFGNPDDESPRSSFDA
jgi:hypothetical protein